MTFQYYLPFYKRNLKVALPVMITQAGQVVVQLCDNIMVGHLGVAQLAGVSFGNAIFLIGFVCAIGFSQATTPIIGQAFGKQDYKTVTRILCNSTFLNIALAVLLTLIMGVAGLFLGYMGQDADVLYFAKQYYFINVVSFLPSAIFFSSRYFSEGIGNTKYAMWITIGANIINIALNWILIYGKLGVPQLGVAGAAYATLISRVISAVAFVILLFAVKEYKFYIKLFEKPFIDKKSLKSILALAIPSSGQSVLEITTFSLAAVMVGWLGKYALAAHQIAQNLSTLTFMIATGIGSAATIRVSHQFGKGQFREMRSAGMASVHMSVTFMGFFGLLFIIFCKHIPWLYTTDIQTISIATRLIVIVAVYQVFDAMQLSCISSLRGLKDVKKPFVYSIIVYYLFLLPVSYILGFVFDFGADGVWSGIVLGLILAATLFYVRFDRITKNIIKENDLIR